MGKDIELAMNIVYIYADSKEEWNCSEWRCAIPTRAINKSGKHTATMVWKNDWTESTDESKKIMDGADIVIVQRVVLPINMKQIAQLRASGKSVLLDLDDAYHFMLPSLASYSYWIEGKVFRTDGNGNPKKDDDGKVRGIVMPYPPIEILEWSSKIVSAISSPSELICHDWSSRFGVKTVFLPNLLESSLYKPAAERLSDKLIVGWGGSLSHYQGFVDSDILSAIRKISRERNDVEFRIIGGIGNIIERRLPDVKMTSIPRVTPDVYPSELSKIDIAVIPLVGLYDRRRSWIKALECLSLGIPWIATRGEPYARFSKYGTLIDNSARSWYLAMNTAIDNYARLRAIALENAQDIMIYDMDANVDNYIKILERVIYADQHPFQSNNEWSAAHWPPLHDIGE